MTSAPAVKAALAYFALVFAAGFALGALRVLALAPRLGELVAVLLELPLMLAVSWAACGWALRRFAVSRAWPARLAMGALAFVLLMAAELALAVAAFGQAPAAWLAALSTPAGAAGLLGQLAFALTPLVRHKRGS